MKKFLGRFYPVLRFIALFTTGPGLMGVAGVLLYNGDGGWNLVLGIISFVIGWGVFYEYFWK